MKKSISILALLATTIIGVCWFTNKNCGGACTSDQAQHPGPDAPKDVSGDNPNGRLEWEVQRLADVTTGKIPHGIRKRELGFAATLPKDAVLAKAAGNDPFDWHSIGPVNRGGRTRALAIDVANNDVVLAGGVSGGMWRSEDFGESWAKVTGASQHHSVTCIVQDTRAGQTNTWYYGSGEVSGNSASKSFSAFYLGNGIYKSTDGGVTWESLIATADSTPQDEDPWDLVWGMALDPSNTIEDEVYAALQGLVMRSTDGGQSWTQVLGQSGFFASYYTEVLVTDSGVVYATLSSDGSDRGLYRSADGINWVDIKPAGWPGTYDRVIMAQVPNTDEVYFLAETPNAGQQANTSSAQSEYHSLWHYTYVSGDGTGAGGTWTDLSSNLPQDTLDNSTFRTQGSYDICMSFKPDDPNVVFIGGTNVFRSSDAFTSPDNTLQIGGYLPGGSSPWGYRWEGHHPDQHVFAFKPSNPNVMLNANDGGIYIADDCMLDSILWRDGSNGFTTSQFYTVAIPHGTPGGELVTGGLQDNGTQYTNSLAPGALWTQPNLGDGSFCAFSNNGTVHYSSRQYGRIIKSQIDNLGQRVAYQRIDPEGGNSYTFVNTFILDPTDDNVMYLGEGNHIWRNTDLSDIPFNNEYSKISTNWNEMLNWAGGGPITALACSENNPPHRLYYGTSNRRIFRVDDANTSNADAVEVTSNIVLGGYTSCIAVDPTDADKVMVIYSNYNMFSAYYSEDGGTSWTPVGGNLEDEQLVGAPAGLVEGDGPSFRYAAIVPVFNGTVYLLGTSIGLYATSELDGENTVWVQQGADVIGNVVVDMIDYRQSDGLVVAATHGNGVYAANVESIWGITGQEAVALLQGPQMEVFPNPVQHKASIGLHLDAESRCRIYVMNSAGQMQRELLNGVKAAGEHRIVLDAATLTNGLYFVVAECNGKQLVKRLVVAR